jgi:hypothetical protein
LCWISLLSRVGVVVNNLWEILFLTHRARFLRRALEIEGRPYNASLIRIRRMGFTPNRSTAGSAQDATNQETFRPGRLWATPSNALIEQRFDQAKDTLRITDNSAGRERPPTLNVQQSSPAIRPRDATSRAHKTTAVHRGRVYASDRADSTFGSMDGTAPCSPGTTDLVVWLRSQTSVPKTEGPLTGRELRSLIRRNRS